MLPTSCATDIYRGLRQATEVLIVSPALTLLPKLISLPLRRKPTAHHVPDRWSASIADVWYNSHTQSRVAPTGA